VTTPRTMFDKVWSSHIVAEEEGEILLYVDRALIHEGSSHAFAALKRRSQKVARPHQVFAFTDHYVPTSGRDKGIAGIAVDEIRNMVIAQHENTKLHGIRLFGFDDPAQGILHIVPPEQGITQPGMLIAGADSHTSTHGAFGAIAFGMGASDMTHVMATQATWQRKPRTLRIVVDGELGFGVAPKDIILAVIANIGAGGGVGHAIEYAGSIFRRMSMEGRMTVCNMSIEAGARCGMIAADDTTFAYMDGRPWAPKKGAEWDAAMALWKTLPSDDGAAFDREVRLEAAQIEPMVTWGVNPEMAGAVGGNVPDPKNAPDERRRSDWTMALDYMGLQAGMALQDIRIDRVFIGSCTNSRIEDIRAAAEVAKRGKAVVPAWVVPGSQTVKRQAEAEGLDKILTAAGFEWRDPGCSLCTAINGDQLKPGERCASTSNRNFRNRQGPGGRTHLVSPAMAAAAAIKGHFADVREVLK
jgi:3-isopropylmalate/(R)-2-methylmalate dehydratase large subunit